MPAMPADALRRLQAAAREYARLVLPGSCPRRVIILDEHRERIAEVRIPACADREEPTLAPEVRPGWDFSRPIVRMDGAEHPMITGRNRAVLRLLAEAEGPLDVDALRAAWPDYKPADNSVRNQVGELRKVLRKLWPDWAGDPIPANGTGYVLEIR